MDLKGPCITVVGLGPGAPGQMTLGALEVLRSARRVILRTERHPAVEELRRQGISFETCDDLYERAEKFEDVYEEVARRVLMAWEKVAPDPLAYAVPGHPLVGEESVRRLLALAAGRGIKVELEPGLSFLEAVYTRMRLDPLQGLVVLDALAPEWPPLPPSVGRLVAQLHSRLVASDVKLRLMRDFPDEYKVFLIRAAGQPGRERVEELPLYQLDRLEWLDHETSLYVPGNAVSMPEGRIEAAPSFRGPAYRLALYPLDPLVGVMQRLRGEGGCPWDRAQSHQSLKPYMVEESYEIWEAIDEGDADKLCEELGDLLLQIIFHAQIASEEGSFDFNDVVEGVVAKMIRRHPHVFGEAKVSGVQEVIENWEEIKRRENGKERPSFLDGIPLHLPALSYAQKVQRKAAQVGFDWEDLRGVVQKVWEEAREVQHSYRYLERQRASGASEAALAGARGRLEGEFGDLLFAVVNLARFLDVDAEASLRRAVHKFQRRFRRLEELARTRGKGLEEMSLAEMDSLWEEAKKEEAGEKAES